MNITDPMVIPPDVLIVPILRLPASIRRRIEARDGDYAITRQNGRSASKIVDPDTAGLLKAFRTPCRIADAVVAFSRDRDLDPREVLSEVSPVLQECYGSRFLVPADSPDADLIMPMLERGDRVDGWEVSRCIQALADSELYQVSAENGQLAALKILRPGAPPTSAKSLDREAKLLAHLDGLGCPRLVGTGRFNRRRYVLMEWAPGIFPGIASSELRDHVEEDGGAALLTLVTDVAEAYARLHERNVVHGDVNAKNLLVERNGTVTILDLGYARSLDVTVVPPRGGVAFFYEPEFAVAQARKLPPATMAGEQYAVGALLYRLFTGNDYLDFLLEKKQMLRQIAEDPPLPFSRRGVAPWPEIEGILARALAKNPVDRFPSMRHLSNALRNASSSWRSIASTAEVADRSRTLTQSVLTLLRVPGSLYEFGFPRGPQCSINHGAAGAAYGLYRMACVRNSPDLLATADAWITRAQAQIDAPEAFYNQQVGLTPGTIGRVSPYHTACGVHAVRALTAIAAGDESTAQVAIEHFLASADAPTDELDLTLGRAGTVLATAFLLEAYPGWRASTTDALQQFGERTMNGIWARLEALAPVGDSTELKGLGMAHGWAGPLYATLRWCRAAGRSAPASLETRLRQLAKHREPTGRGIAWPMTGDGHASADGGFAASWCNGSAGFVFLWTLAHETFSDPDYLDLAVSTGWHVFEQPVQIVNLCCGAAGRGYALLNLYKHTGDGRWLERAQTLGRTAAARADQIDADLYASLYRGKVGIANLLVDLEHPEGSCMPFFESEGWS